MLVGNKNSVWGKKEVETLKNGLISVWELDETSGTVVVDSHGVNNGYNNGATINQSGIINKSYSFNGVDNSIIIPDSTSLDLTSGITISTWINTNSFNSIFVAKRNNSNYSFDLNTFSTGVIYFAINSNTNRADTVGFPLNLNQNYHIAATYDKVNIKIYINGVERGTAPYASDVSTNNVDLTIGQRLFVGAEGYFDGLIDQTSLWNRALIKSEIEYLYNNGSGLAYLNW